MKIINNINKYSYNSNLIDNIELFIKLNNGINYYNFKYWYKNGKRHRENDKPAIELGTGAKEWFIHDKFIKRNYDNNYNTYTDKLFDWNGRQRPTNENVGL
jgi:hypothetical protein